MHRYLVGHITIDHKLCKWIGKWRHGQRRCNTSHLNKIDTLLVTYMPMRQSFTYCNKKETPEAQVPFLPIRHMEMTFSSILLPWIRSANGEKRKKEEEEEKVWRRKWQTEENDGGPWSHPGDGVLRGVFTLGLISFPGRLLPHPLTACSLLLRQLPTKKSTDFSFCPATQIPSRLTGMEGKENVTFFLTCK